jgi:hypothetical protein
MHHAHSQDPDGEAQIMHLKKNPSQRRVLPSRMQRYNASDKLQCPTIAMSWFLGMPDSGFSWNLPETLKLRRLQAFKP